VAGLPPRRPLDPTGMFLPGARPITRADWRRKRIAINVSFLWLAVPIGDLAHSDPPAWRIAVAAAGVVVFVAAYNWLPGARMRAAARRHVWTALLVLLGTTIALSAIDRASWTLLFVFTAISGSMALSRQAGALWVGACTVVCLATNVGIGSSTGTTLSLSATTLAIGFMMLAFRQLIDVNQELVAAREEVARLAVSEERARFARDLHDLLGHSLTVIAVKAELAERLIAAGSPDVAQHVGDITTVARSALGEVREAVSDYRRPTLVSEMAGARMALEAAGIEARLESTDMPLPPEVEAVLAWAVREGTTNTIRHSGARSCRIAVAPSTTTASAEIVDDGGAAPATQRAGNGLAGLRERVERVAGRLEAGPTPEGGFRLAVTIPLAPAGP
jgi:two-component system sensor histidine kinase DesK